VLEILNMAVEEACGVFVAVGGTVVAMHAGSALINSGMSGAEAQQNPYR
jgi:hypothetical protein